jgi:peptidylprolyl isomerase
MRRMLFVAGGFALVIILVAVIVSVSAGGRKMSDGSDGSADDAKLVEIKDGGGVKFRDLKEGSGEPCPPGAKVKINYSGWLTDGTGFDSNKGKPPALFDLNELIKGWQVGIPGMKPGGIRKLVVPPEMGYGAKGSPPSIPGNSTLIFEVELVSFTGGGPPPRPRRSPAPTDLTKLSDGTDPGAEDPGLKPLGSAGLKYRDIKEGDGPVVPAGSTVVVDYIGWFTTGGQPFDSSWKGGGHPYSASLSAGVIQGWMDGIPGMKVGGIRKLVIPPELAYGREGRSGIPPNSTLVFEVEVLGIK